METADAPGVIDRRKLTESLKLTGAELNVDECDLPTIIVFHLSKVAAAKLHLTGSFTAINRTDSTTRYEMWIIGEPSDYVYSGMAENIVVRHFQWKVKDSERTRIVQSVQSRLGMIVSAEALQKKSD